ncbi:MAG: UV DNA damage repair endonuclease UvsE [Chloroflexi bacterium]|nr:UV DNA damage repair endonuclease UvsE [Chloroflexota bacterium]
MPRFGYPVVSVLLNRTTNRTCRLKSATPEKLRDLITQNLDDLAAILAHNALQGWALFRIGSSVIPFASHPDVDFDWRAEFRLQLEACGQFARARDLRLSMHPGQYTVLNSPDEDTAHAAVAELVYSADLLDMMGLDARHKIVLHIGGVYGDKPAATARFVENAAALPFNVRARLVIEHDERQYNLAEVLDISAQTGLPVVYDNLHHDLNPSPQPLDELLPRVFATWRDVDGPPKVHFSSQAVGERPGKHAEFADQAEFQAMLASCKPFGEFDVMLELKGKDAALRQALERIPVR